MSLHNGDKYDHYVFRLVSLWLTDLGRVVVAENLKTLMLGVPSYKFITLLPQMVPRMYEDPILTAVVGKYLGTHSISFFLHFVIGHCNLILMVTYPAMCVPTPFITFKKIKNALFSK